MRAFVILACCLAVTGCATEARDNPPKVTVLSKRPHADIAACVVSELNRELGGPAISGGQTHRVETIIPGKVWEVTPQRKNPYHGDIYLVRLTAVPSGTRIEAFHPPFATWAVIDTIPARCA